MKKRLRNAGCLLLGIVMLLGLTGCNWAGLDNDIQEIKGSIKGCTYNCMFYSNTGERFMTVQGENISLSSNVVRERSYSEDGGWGYVDTLSSVVTITVDGSQIENCGSTVIFAQDDLEPDADFEGIDSIESESNGITDWTMIAGVVNSYKNYFGKPTVVVIQSQLGVPICAYSGKDVYWEVCEDLPKTTKLMIDGKALYIHRANFQIIDRDLL